MAENIGGFSFADEDLAHLAKKEVQGVEYVRTKVNMDNPEAVLQVYQKMIRGRMFQTQVGIAYLYELQSFLKAQPDIDKRAIIPIPAAASVELTESPVQVREYEAKLKEQKKWLSLSVTGIFVLLVVIVFMMVIAATRGSTTILNYENAIIDKYSEWEQELTERENALKNGGN